MAASKKPASTRRAAASKPQAFDIIPRSQVKPSASARPVITATSPEQPDNTLLQPATLAIDASQLSHQPLKLKPTGDVTAKDAAVDATPAADLGRRLSGTDKPAEDMAAKDVDDIPTAPIVPAGADPDAIKAKLGKRAAAEKVAKETETVETEDAADTTAEEPKADKPKDDAEPPKTAGDTKPDEPAEPADDAEKPEEPETNADTKPEDAKDDVPKTEGAESAPKDDVSAESPSDMKDLGGVPAEDDKVGGDEAEEDDKAPKERQHHELYGGKPVIVIHKHGRHSALKTIVWVIICLIVAVAIVDVLLDAGVITTDYDVPYTDFL